MKLSINISTDDHDSVVDRIRAGEKDLRNLNLEGANLTGLDLKGALLNETVLRRANLSGADLEGACLNGAFLYEANLSWACFNNVSLVEARLCRANLQRSCSLYADFRCADLEEANLNEATLVGAKFEKANLTGCIGNGKEMLSLQGGPLAVAYDVANKVLWIGRKGLSVQDWRLVPANQFAHWMADKSCLPFTDLRDWCEIWKPVIDQFIAASVS